MSSPGPADGSSDPEVVRATSLFLFGIAGISSRRRIKIGALSAATFVFLVAVAVLVTV